MILTSLTVNPSELERATGWSIKPEGACKAEMCVPLAPEERSDMVALSERLAMPLIQDRGVWALGPSTISGRTLSAADAPDFSLPDHRGNLFNLRSLRGQKIFLLAWASW